MQLSPLFADHMVLQADKPVRVFGTGSGTVAVSFCGHDAAVTTQEERWLCTLPAMPAGGPYTMRITLDGCSITLQDVWVGQVLLCAGQSNMQFTMNEEITPPDRYDSDAGLRIYTLDRPENLVPCAPTLTPADGWLCCKAENVGRWSALGYHIGRQLRQRTGQAVGIILCAQGASVIQSWMEPARIPAHAAAIPAQQLFVDHTVYSCWNAPGFLYQYMLRPAMPYSAASVIWYQGESNASPAEAACYVDMLAAMVANWRELSLDPTLPFIAVQIADTRTDEGWLAIQAAQATAPAAIPGLRTVVSGDISEKAMIHPVTKGPLAARIVDMLLVDH